jgi:predicted component of type VI protein secretion system
VPYVVIKTNGQEVARRELDCGLVIGRAPDCDVTVPDILLSRRHCRLQPSDDGWMIQDLQSKHGTVFNGERLRTPKVLSDNDVVRFGRSKIIFHAGLIDEDFADDVLAPTRPATPGDSLAGTLSGFTLLLPGEGEIPEDMPCPQPRPKDPPAYDKSELQELLTAIASSSWDSVYAEARQPLRGGQGLEKDKDEESTQRRRARPSSPTDLSLQFTHPQAPVVEATATVAVAVSVPRTRKIPSFRLSLHAAVAMVWVGLVVLLSLNQKPLADGSTARTTPSVKLIPQNDSDIDTPVDGDLMKAADQELLETPPAPKPAIKWNIAAAKEASKTAALYLPLIWQ